MTSIFSKIIRGEIQAEKVFENERIIAIKDIFPKAPVHLLIIPKKEIRCMQEATHADLPLVAECIEVAQKLAKEFGIEENYRFLTNNGSLAGQSVFHLHFHLLGGTALGQMV